MSTFKYGQDSVPQNPRRQPKAAPPATSPTAPATTPTATPTTPSQTPTAPTAPQAAPITHPFNTSVAKMQNTMRGFSNIITTAAKEAQSTTAILVNRYLPEINKDLSTDPNALATGIQNIGQKGTSKVDGVWGSLTQRALYTIYAVSAGLMQIAAKFNPKLPQPTEALNSLKQIASEDYRTFTDVGGKAEQATKALEELETFAQSFIHSEIEASNQQTNTPSLFEQPAGPTQTLSKDELLALQSDPDRVIGNVAAKGTNTPTPIHLKDIQTLATLKTALAPLGITDPKEIASVIGQLKTQQSFQPGF